MQSWVWPYIFACGGRIFLDRLASATCSRHGWIRDTCPRTCLEHGKLDIFLHVAAEFSETGHVTLIFAHMPIANASFQRTCANICMSSKIRACWGEFRCSNWRKRSRIWAHLARPEFLISALQFECRGVVWGHQHSKNTTSRQRWNLPEKLSIEVTN